MNKTALIAAVIWLGLMVPAQAGEYKIMSCDSDAMHALSPGLLMNNTWNKASAGPGDWKQCLISRVVEGQTQYGWSWQWPVKDGIYAYPEILTGGSPWRGGMASNDPRFPRSIGNTKALWVDYSVDIEFAGKHNLATEFWLTDPTLTVASPEKAIKAELMIWTQESPGLIAPALKPLAQVAIDGVNWTLYTQPGWGDASGGSSSHWTLISYHADRAFDALRFDARKILQDAIDRKLIEPRYVINGVDFGTELISGTGRAWVNHLTIDIE